MHNLQNKSNKTITILDVKDVQLNPGSRIVNVTFQDLLETDKYGLMVQINNLKDTNPQSLIAVVVAKNSYGFQVELNAPTDSPNYILSYIAYEEEVQKAPTVSFEPLFADPGPPPDIKVKCWSHKWKRYTGLMDSFNYCEICDEKRK